MLAWVSVAWVSVPWASVAWEVLEVFWVEVSSALPDILTLASVFILVTLYFHSTWSLESLGIDASL